MLGLTRASLQCEAGISSRLTEEEVEVGVEVVTCPAGKQLTSRIFGSQIQSLWGTLATRLRWTRKELGQFINQEESR